jgi:hypothetical protein
MKRADEMMEKVCRDIKSGTKKRGAFPPFHVV